MEDKPRELAEMVREAYRAGFIAACKWPEPVSQDVDSSAYIKEFNAWSFSVREKHAAIIDAEGDGGAVGDEVVDRVAKAIADAAGHGMREKCEHMAYAAIAAYHLATWNPVRSVSDEDVEECWMVLTGRAGSIAHEKDHECMMDIERKAVRAALEHFAAIAQEKRS
jgi:hypothetical protein